MLRVREETQRRKKECMFFVYVKIILKNVFMFMYVCLCMYVYMNVYMIVYNKCKL